MKKLLVILLVAVASFGAIQVADPAPAQAGKVWVYAKCKRPSTAVPYPHWSKTRVTCYAPGLLVRVTFKYACKIRTYPILPWP